MTLCHILLIWKDWVMYIHIYIHTLLKKLTLCHILRMIEELIKIYIHSQILYIIHTHTHTHTNLHYHHHHPHAHIFIFIWRYIYTIHTNIYLCVYMYIYICVCVCVCVCECGTHKLTIKLKRIIISISSYYSLSFKMMSVCTFFKLLNFDLIWLFIDNNIFEWIILAISFHL